MPFVRVSLKSLIRQSYGFEAKTLGEHIRRQRLVLSLTQEEAALLLGVNLWTVHNWEVGATKPAIQFIPAIVGFLGYDPEPMPRAWAGDYQGKPVSRVGGFLQVCGSMMSCSYGGYRPEASLST